MAGHGGGYTITVSQATGMRQEGRDSFTGTDGDVYTLRPCNRCGGSGQYSYCQRFGTTCFGCGGAQVVAVKGDPEQVRAAEEKRLRQRERARERRLERAAAKAATQASEDERIAGLLGIPLLPPRRGRITVMPVRYTDTCHYCWDSIAVGADAALGDFRGVYHPWCFADVLLNDIEDYRTLADNGDDLPF